MNSSKTQFKIETALQRFFVSFCISTLMCTLIAIYFLLTAEEQFFHWFLIPLILSGIVIGIDAVEWFRGGMSIFDPVGILGLLGFHCFFLAPLLNVSWDVWLDPWIPAPPDWKPWLGGMAILNFFGLILYRFFCGLSFTKVNNHTYQRVWILNPKRIPLILGCSLIFSALLQLMVYVQYGGILGYISFFSVYNAHESIEGVQGGLIFVFSESFPILAMIGFAIYAKRYKRMQTWFVLIGVLLVFLVLSILFGGLRGSRSNTVWALFWAVGIIHFWIRPINRKQIAIGIVFLTLFMYLYGFFKAGSIEGFQAILQGEQTVTEAEQKSGRTFQSMLLGDMARSSLHAQLLYRIMLPSSDYEYAWGRTYGAAITILIPKTVISDKPPTKAKEGTELMHGWGSWIPGKWVSSSVYGITGEAMLNFGPFAVPFAFIPLGILVGRVRSLLFTLKPFDIRTLLLPMMVNLCFVVLNADLDNDIFFLVKNCGFPTFVVFMISDRTVIALRNQNIIDI